MSTLTFDSFLANALVTAAHSHMTSYWLLATSLVLLPHSPFPTHHSPLPIPISPSSLPLAHCRKAPSMYQCNPCPICRGASVSQPLTSLPRSLSDHLRSRKRFFPSHNPTTPPPTRTEKHRESHRPNPHRYIFPLTMTMQLNCNRKVVVLLKTVQALTFVASQPQSPQPPYSP